MHLCLPPPPPPLISGGDIQSRFHRINYCQIDSIESSNDRLTTIWNRKTWNIERSRQAIYVLNGGILDSIDNEQKYPVHKGKNK